jgi:hypothetical protein
LSPRPKTATLAQHAGAYWIFAHPFEEGLARAIKTRPNGEHTNARSRVTAFPKPLDRLRLAQGPQVAAKEPEPQALPDYPILPVAAVAGPDCRVRTRSPVADIEALAAMGVDQSAV